MGEVYLPMMRKSDKDIFANGYFWIAIPIDDFFCYSNDIMKKYNVSAYVEMKSAIPGKSDYLSYNEENKINFFSCFSSSNYRNFFFSDYAFKNNVETSDFGMFYDPPVSTHSIEGSGGRETGKTRELIHLRRIMKQSDKSISLFYASLQRKLKKIPKLQSGLVMGNHNYKNHYYLPTSKIIIPQDSHSGNVQGTWEEYYLTSERYYRRRSVGVKKACSNSAV